MGIWLLVLFVLAMATILAFKSRSRSSFLNGREPRLLAEIHADVRNQVSFEVFEEVLLKIGEAFSIDPQIIKPTDTLKSFASLDSWDLGRGEEALHAWVENEHFGVPPRLESVLDFAKWVQLAKANKGHL